MVDLRIAHLYPDLMSIYGDRGNVLALDAARALARHRRGGAHVHGGPGVRRGLAGLLVLRRRSGSGAGHRRRRSRGAERRSAEASLANGAAALTICGGYQLLGHEYIPENAPAIPGSASSMSARARARCGSSAISSPKRPTVCSSVSRITAAAPISAPKAKPLGTVVVGNGNNGEDKTEGAVQDQIVGTYSHGSCLPKNPWLADRLLAWALERRHGPQRLAPLDDREEKAASEQAAEVARARA